MLIKGSAKNFTPTRTLEGESLHVGISNSKNQIYHFLGKYHIDETTKKWQSSLVIPLQDPTMSDEEFDLILQQVIEEAKQSKTKYKFLPMNAKESDLDKKNDCFSFAIRILNALKWDYSQNHDLM